MRNCASRSCPPALRMRTAAAAEVPPVASKSSTSTICSPGVMASMCISISASPYSSEYFSISVLYGNFPRLRIGTKRSEEHTSELQSRGHLVCRLLLEKKKEEHHKC